MTAPTKTIHALWEHTALTSSLQPAFRHDLALAGAVRVQVNVDDADVAEARLRSVNGPRPIRTVISVWSEYGPGAVTEAVRSLDRSESVSKCALLPELRIATQR